MKRFPRVLIGLAGLLLAGVAAGDEPPPLLRVVASEWSPYVDASINRSGVAPQLVRAALRRGGYRVQLFIDDWPRSLEATQAGDFDAIVGLWYTAERAETIAFSEPFMANKLQFMKRAAADIQLNNREDFVGLRVGIVRDYAYSDRPYDTEGIEIVGGGSVGENVGRLLAGELDLVLGDALVLRHEADRRRAAKELTVLPLVLESRGLHLGVSRQRPDHAQIVAAFDAGIEAMKADGSYASLLANYRVSD